MANGLVTLVAQELRRPGGEALARELGVENALADDDCGEAPVVGIPWPSPPTPEAFHGLAGRIVRAIEPHTEADPMALLVQLLLAFGNAIGRGPHFMAEADRHGLNLFACLVGATAKGRKGTSWGHVRRIFEATDPKWVKEGIASGLSSGEGLIWAVRNPIERNEPVKEKGRTTGYETVLVDEGVEDKRLLVFEGEFASVLRILGREGNTLSAIIRNAWDTGELRSLTKNSPAVASGAHISISGLGSITGSVIAATLVTVAMEVLRALEEPRVILGMFLPGIPGMRMVVFSIALMAVILFYPKGFMGDREVSLDSFRNLAARFRRTFLRKQV